LVADEHTGTTLNDASGNGEDGSINGVTPNNTAGVDGRRAMLWDGANDYGSWYTANINTAFDGSEGSMIIWVKAIDANFWTDNSTRWFVRVRGSTGGGSVHTMWLQKTSANNVSWQRQANGSTQGFNESQTPTGWFSMGMTWSETDDELKMYYNGDLRDTDSSIASWTDTTLQSNTVALGSQQNTSGVEVMDGWLQHFAVWDTPLSEAQMSMIGRP
jgi:hypothetical protein